MKDLYRRPPMKADPKGPCPQFYAFGAPYPDGYCHDGHIDDADSDRCYADFDYRPCPNCNNAEYLKRLRAGGEFMPPYGYDEVVPGDYFALPPPKKSRKKSVAA